ncbi:TRAP transporter fused permease subunit [Gammaproteobacteria bacterium]|nr:TRAP transporter fused permease subunit [Gammaproteobacteria bacterium]
MNPPYPRPHVATWLAAAVAVFNLWLAVHGPGTELFRQASHFVSFAVLAWLLPADSDSPISLPRSWVPWTLMALTVGFGAWVIVAKGMIYERGVRLSVPDMIAGVGIILIGLELTRRRIGWLVPSLILIGLAYVAGLGKFVPGVFNFPGLQPETVLFRSLYGDDGMFGTISRISLSYVFVFILFGAFLLRSGAGDFIIDIARAVAGRSRSGPGAVAVIASALTGTISGSAVANTASTGVITIPLMMKVGYPPKFAAAVEATSSTGGQLVPPIMGAGAFVMASITGIAYHTIAVASILPAVLYFVTVLLFVNREAIRCGLQPSRDPDAPAPWALMRERGLVFLVPIATLVGTLIAGYSPTWCAMFGIIAVIVSSWLGTVDGKRMGMGPRAILEALALGARNMVMTAVLLCCIGLLVNVIATTGVGNTFSLMIANWSGGNIVIAVVLIGLASLVLGMGLPVTAAYIVLATLSAPALQGMIVDSLVIERLAAGDLPDAARAVFSLVDPALKLDALDEGSARTIWAAVPPDMLEMLRGLLVDPAAVTQALLIAHLVVFWLSQDSNVTPPVALASFTAAGIAKSPPMATAVSSWKLAKGLYIVPLLMIWQPLLGPDWTAALGAFALSVVGIYAAVRALSPPDWSPRALIEAAAWGGAALLVLLPLGLTIELMGLALVVAMAWLLRGRDRQVVATGS